MDITHSFIFYLILFRLSIISAGVISIILGYRLFCKGVWPEIGRGGTSVDAKIVGYHFTLKNAAPGTCFAFFGVLIISIMFVSGSPELTLKTLKETKQLEESIQDTNQVTYTELHLKKATISKINLINQNYERDYISAEEAYQQLYNLVKEGNKEIENDKVKE